MAKPEFHFIHESLAYCGSDFRIERGPALKTAKATPEMLSDEKTASHYYAPRPMVNAQGHPYKNKSGKPKMEYARDAVGNPIELNKEFTFLDWKNPDTYVWYVYERFPREVYVNDPKTGAILMDDDTEEPLTQVNESNFEEVGVFPTLDEAKAFVFEHVDDSGKPKAHRAKKKVIPLRRRVEDKDPPLDDLRD